jgi:Tat protein translocase TatB subunit
MFDVGFWELILVFGLGLVILGPERLPRVAAQVGRWVARARRTATQLRRQLEMEIKLDDPPTYKRPKPPPASSTPASTQADETKDDGPVDHFVEEDTPEEDIPEEDTVVVEPDPEEPNPADTHGKD